MAVQNKITDEGRQLGEQLARWCDDAEPKARLRMPEIPPRCQSCAFRNGPHLANGSPATQMDALKCVLEGAEFQCHQPSREGHLCSGWAMMMLANDEAEFISLPWDFIGVDRSDESESDAISMKQPLLTSTASQEGK